MQISCSICLNYIEDQGEEIYSTHCGHTFHGDCLKKWLEGSQTCPHCRKPTTQRNLTRMYFTSTLSYGADRSAVLSIEDSIKLQNTVLDLETKVRDKEKENEDMKHETTRLHGLIDELNTGLERYETVIKALRDQVHHYKNQARDSEKYAKELFRIKERVKVLESAQKVIDGSSSELENIIEDENNANNKVLLNAFKKSLIDVKKKNTELDAKNKQLQNQVNNQKVKCEQMDVLINKLRADIAELTMTKELAELKEFIYKPISPPSPVRDVVRTSGLNKNSAKETNESPYLNLKYNSLGGINTDLKKGKRRAGISSTISKNKFLKLAPHK